MAETDYATLADVKAWLGITGTSQDGILPSAISAASRSIDRYCGRRFWADDLAYERIFDTEFADIAWVPDIAATLTLLAGATVETDSTGDGNFDTTWTANARTGYGYAFLPRIEAAEQAETRPHTEIRALSGSFPIGFGRLRITAVWGFDAVPDEISLATQMWASRLWKRKDAVLGVSGGPDVGFVELARRLDPDIQRAIRPYVRTSAAAVGI